MKAESRNRRRAWPVAASGTPSSACASPRTRRPARTAAATRSGRLADAASSDWIWLWKIAPSAAMPVAIPTWRNVLLMPEAIPARRGSTTLTDVEASGALTSPIPMPPTMKPARSVVHVEPSVTPVHEQERDADQRRARRRAGTEPESASRAALRSARRRTRRARAAGRSRPSPRPSSRARSRGRAAGRGTARTSPTRSRRP